MMPEYPASFVTGIGLFGEIRHRGYGVSSANLKLNWYNGLSVVFMIISGFLYARCIGLNGRDINFFAGMGPFLISIPLLYFSLRDQRNFFREYSWLKNARNRNFYYDI